MEFKTSAPPREKYPLKTAKNQKSFRKFAPAQPHTIERRKYHGSIAHSLIANIATAGLRARRFWQK
jgi:hypothetical protein